MQCQHLHGEYTVLLLPQMDAATVSLCLIFNATADASDNLLVILNLITLIVFVTPFTISLQA